MVCKSIIRFFVICTLCFLNTACKKDTIDSTDSKPKVVGCMDPEATNYDGTAELKGFCNYTPIIKDPSFETFNDWTTYSGTGYNPNAGRSNVNDGFMPTAGQYYLKCIPSMNYVNGTQTQQYSIKANKYFKGFYFDYSYTAKARSADSVLQASFGLSYTYKGGGVILWNKTISETPSTFGNYPDVLVQKRDQYAELPYTESEAVMYISTVVSKGTFTFCVDNIRMVQADQ